jgi:hypothetical protein
MTHSELKEIIMQALDMLYARDSFLLEKDASEWAIAHRLAVYIEKALPGWHVDCEYNRQGPDNDVKKTTKTTNGAAVRPDIIVHHRGCVDISHNLLAIELKKSASDKDFAKLKQYTAKPTGNRKFQYQYGLALEIRKQEQKLTWFENGSCIS